MHGFASLMPLQLYLVITVIYDAMSVRSMRWRLTESFPEHEAHALIWSLNNCPGSTLDLRPQKSMAKTGMQSVHHVSPKQLTATEILLFPLISSLFQLTLPSMVITTRSPLGSSFRLTLVRKSMADMIPSPNYVIVGKKSHYQRTVLGQTVMSEGLPFRQ